MCKTPRRILLVEDDGELQDAIRDALSARGMDVTTVDDGREGLARMRELRPDIVVLDLMMPVMDGWQFRVEQKRDPVLANTPVIAISASQSPTAAAIDADAYLQKPCSADALLRTIDQVLEVRRRRDEPARIAQSERLAALGTLAAGIAHEINNPLTYLLLHLGQASRVIQHLADDGDPARISHLDKLIAQALEGAGRIRDITRGVRVFSRGEPAPLQRLDVRGPLGAALSLIGNDLRHRARLIREDRGAGFVHADEGRLAQVFLNLLSNAVQAIPEGEAQAHEIRVGNRIDREGRVVVDITDTGGGIPAELQGRIFEPFFTTKPIGEGSGLGLWITHGIVTALGGEIAVESEVGVGTRFSVRLPPAHAGESA